MYFVSSENVSEEGNTIHFVRKSTNLTLSLKNLVVSGSSLHEFETCMDAILTKDCIN